MRKRTVGVNCKKKQLIMNMDKDPPERVEIHPYDNKSLWNLFKEFFNSLEINEKFTRQCLLYAVYKKESADALKNDNTTVDTYRCYMKNLGMLEMVGRGIYQKKMNIPKDATITTVRKAVSDHSWREWFMPLHERLGVSKEELL